MLAALPTPEICLTNKRNCSISPFYLLAVLCALMALSSGIGIVFALLGAWPILPIAGIEMLALALAFYLNGRRASNYERIVISGSRLIVEVREAQETNRQELNAPWTRVDEREIGSEYRLALRGNGREIEVGRHLDAERRRDLAAALKKELASRCYR